MKEIKVNFKSNKSNAITPPHTSHMPNTSLPLPVDGGGWEAGAGEKSRSRGLRREDSECTPYVGHVRVDCETRHHDLAQLTSNIQGSDRRAFRELYWTENTVWLVVQTHYSRDVLSIPSDVHRSWL